MQCSITNFCCAPTKWICSVTVHLFLFLSVCVCIHRPRCFFVVAINKNKFFNSKSRFYIVQLINYIFCVFVWLAHRSISPWFADENIFAQKHTHSAIVKVGSARARSEKSGMIKIKMKCTQLFERNRQSSCFTTIQLHHFNCELDAKHSHGWQNGRLKQTAAIKHVDFNVKSKKKRRRLAKKKTKYNSTITKRNPSSS